MIVGNRCFLYGSYEWDVGEIAEFQLGFSLDDMVEKLTLRIDKHIKALGQNFRPLPVLHQKCLSSPLSLVAQWLWESARLVLELASL